MGRVMSQGSFIGIFFVLAVYFMPTLLGLRYDKSNTKKIFLINLFLGFTLLGWLVSLFLACKAEPKPKRKPKILN